MIYSTQILETFKTHTISSRIFQKKTSRNKPFQRKTRTIKFSYILYEKKNIPTFFCKMFWSDDLI